MRGPLTHLAALAVAFAVALAAYGVASAGQPHPDLFDCGTRTCDYFNPVTQKVRQTRRVTWRWVVDSGCRTTGATERAVRAVMSDELPKVGVAAVEVGSGADVTIHGSCGAAFANVCGGPPVVGCLGYGFPQVPDVAIDMSQMDTWSTDVSRTSVVEHEFVGHALGSWNEQYCLGNEPAGNPCYGRARFSPTPAWSDIMNTGEGSRHYLSGVELDRWARTMFAPAPPPDPCRGQTVQWPAETAHWDNCKGRWVGDSSGVEYDPSTGAWYDGVFPWGGCDPRWGGCWSGLVWVGPDGAVYDPRDGSWTPLVPCTSWGGCWSGRAQVWLSGGGDVFWPAIGRWSRHPTGPWSAPVPAQPTPSVTPGAAPTPAPAPAGKPAGHGRWWDPVAEVTAALVALYAVARVVIRGKLW